VRAPFVMAFLLAAPVAAGTGFFLLPTEAFEALSCGDDVCVPLRADERSVFIHEGRRYAFLGPDQTVMAAGVICGTRLLQVPPGATMLLVTPGTC
jgi:hypothetical protein